MFLIPLGSPHARCTPMGHACREPNEFKLTPTGVKLNGSQVPRHGRQRQRRGAVPRGRRGRPGWRGRRRACRPWPVKRAVLFSGWGCCLIPLCPPDSRCTPMGRTRGELNETELTGAHDCFTAPLSQAAAHHPRSRLTLTATSTSAHPTAAATTATTATSTRGVLVSRRVRHRSRRRKTSTTCLTSAPRHRLQSP